MEQFLLMMRPFSLGRRSISGMDETRELSIYQQQCIVSLVEQNGKEKVIDDAYLEHIRLLNEPRLIYVTFDFHEHW